MKRAVFFVIADGREHAVFLLQANLPGHKHVQLALGTLHFDLAWRGVDLHAGRHWNRFATNT